ncbi:SAM-dependent methyltransferase [Pseudoroseomonas globiformis]|uniref:SAM-dependent methyltransferase n=1 Tax=Teichococcus globiformis TaxID=2307229 RepID=A0ABV7FWZ7_9PROT
MKDDPSLPNDYFDALYAASDDPWRFETSDYEQAKYHATLAALPRRRYGRIFEAGCSIGVLTALLASRCDSLLAMDAAAAPLRLARQRLAGNPSVCFRQGRIPENWPDGSFDLVLISELLYYLSPCDVGTVARRAAACLQPGGDVALVHWRPLAEPPFPLTGDAATAAFLAAAPMLLPIHASANAQYRIDILRRPGRACPSKVQPESHGTP